MSPARPSSSLGPQRFEQASSLVAFLRDYAQRRFNARLADARRCLPPQVVLDFGRQGLFGLRVPRAFGGLDLGWQAGSGVLAQLAAIDLSLAMLVGIHNELGIGPILHSGTPDAKAELLPQLATGRMLGGLAITERGAGSNPNAIASTAVQLPDGAWRLSGEKILVGNGSWAGVVNVFARRSDVDGLTGIIGFAVPTETPGVCMGPESMTLGMRSIVQNGIRFDNVRVEAKHLLDRPDGHLEVAEESFRMARLGLAIAATGSMKRCAQLLVRFGSKRRVWTGLLGNNPLFCGAVRAILDSVQVLERLCGLLTEAIDQQRRVPAELFFVCKILGPEFLWFAADNLVQWLGGRGYLESNEAPQILRDARLFRIFEGPTEPMKMQLGSMWQSGGAELRAFLVALPGAEEAVGQMWDACEEIAATPRPSDLSRGQHAFVQRFAIGAVVAAGVAWALVADPASASPTHARVRRQFEDVWRTELHRTSGAAVLDCGTIGASLRVDIGDVVQSMPAEDWALDDLLVPEPS